MASKCSTFQRFFLPSLSTPLNLASPSTADDASLRLSGIGFFSSAHSRRRVSRIISALQSMDLLACSTSICLKNSVESFG
ncbi:hypothetical protein H6P81_013293 [Aristolochia fimbriata]|uniref:Uncharacterized protein n=1 Tax=Aristolochia fimbriata TaxID=158543 RepID=A0AAV7EEB1_ARIFI|nr:hypothetical protein H6P81_013293 [Aristolochia fimbriata]